MESALLSGLLRALCCALFQALFKSGDATTSIKDALLAGVEGMADRTDFDEERTALYRRTSRECLAAATGHCGLDI
ncbi:MAG: hypothetical protein RLZZ17_1023 [Actinomycetota bacterium]|jgi:hypothetical protein